MAGLIQSIVFSGSRLDTGEPNDSGTIYAYLPGTVSPATLYSDADATIAITQPITLDAGGRIPYATYPDGVFITDPVRLLVQDVDGNVVSDAVTWLSDAGTTSLNNDGYTGITVDEALTAIAGSVGGQDGNYQEAGGATARPIQDKFREIQISVKDYGAVGNGIAIDTTAVQNTINRVIALGGGIVYFPPGIYLVDQALTATSATGLTVQGAGPGVSIVKSNNTSANGFTLTTCTTTVFRSLSLRHASTSSGSAFSLTNCTTTTFINVVNEISQFLIGLDQAGASGQVLTLIDSSFYGRAAGRGIKVANPTFIMLGGGAGVGSGTAFEFTGSASDVRVFGALVTTGGVATTTAVLFNAALTGTKFYFAGCTNFGGTTTPFDLSGLATDPILRQSGNGADGYTVDVLSGATATPDRSKGSHIRIRATTTGASITIAAPTPAPTATMYGVTMILDIFNNAGGALSNAYTIDAAYRLTTQPNQTDLNHNVYLLEWDPSASKWRQVALSVNL